MACVTDDYGMPSSGLCKRPLEQTCGVSSSEAQAFGYWYTPTEGSVGDEEERKGLP